MGDTGSLAPGAIAVCTKNEIVLAIVGGLFAVKAISVFVQVLYFKRIGRRVFLMAPIHHHFEKKRRAELQIVIRFWIISRILAMIRPATPKDKAGAGMRQIGQGLAVPCFAFLTSAAPGHAEDLFLDVFLRQFVQPVTQGAPISLDGYAELDVRCVAVDGFTSYANTSSGAVISKWPAPNDSYIIEEMSPEAIADMQPEIAESTSRNIPRCHEHSWFTGDKPTETAINSFVSWASSLPNSVDLTVCRGPTDEPQVIYAGAYAFLDGEGRATSVVELQVQEWVLTGNGGAEPRYYIAAVFTLGEVRLDQCFLMS